MRAELLVFLQRGNLLLSFPDLLLQELILTEKRSIAHAPGFVGWEPALSCCGSTWVLALLIGTSW